MGQALAYAVGVAVSPLPIVVALLLESGDRGSRPEVVEVGRPIAGAVMIVVVSLALVVAISAVGLVVPGTHDALRSVRRRLARREIEIAAAVCFLLGAKLALDGL